MFRRRPFAQALASAHLQLLALNCSSSAYYSYYDFLLAWRAISTNFLLAWSAIPFVQHSPCMFHEGGVKDIRLSDAILAQNEGRRLRRRPSLSYALNIPCTTFTRGRSFGASWGLPPGRCLTEARPCICTFTQVNNLRVHSDNSLARLASLATFASHPSLRKKGCRHTCALVPIGSSAPTQYDYS